MKSLCLFPVLVLAVCVHAAVPSVTDPFNIESNSVRSISVDNDHDTFLLDGKTFRYISGSFHYFRAHPESWRKIIRLMKAAGLNAVSTYIEWSLHNPRDGEYNWEGIADLERFLKTCEEEGMLVLFRPGPYICGERDLGGFPVWLLNKYPAIKLRTMDTNFIREVTKWYSVLMPRIQKHLYGRGGNIILVQVENEYGSFACDHEYTSKIRDITLPYVGTDALLYTTDGPSENMVRCGHVNGTVQSIDFGSTPNVAHQFRELRKYYPKGPLINSEFYPGWLSHWQDDFPSVSADSVAGTLDDMLQMGVNVNFYMFFGGTNFGFTSGANTDPNYRPQTTSYDYDAPLTEAGDVTPKYWKIRNVTAKYNPVADVPENSRKLSLPPMQLSMRAHLFSESVRGILCKAPQRASNPLTFEHFNQKGGLVIYETTLNKGLAKDPQVMNVRSVEDRALVYIDRSFIGVLSRENAINTLAFSPNHGDKLQVIVEDQGRVNYGTLDTWKGIKGVTIEGHYVLNWNSTACPLDDGRKITELVLSIPAQRKRAVLVRGPTFFATEFILNATQLLDTFLDVSGWSKGVAFINGNNLGRYWSTVKPQRTLYVPKEFFRAGLNDIVLLEYQAAINRTVTFLDHPLLRGN